MERRVKHKGKNMHVSVCHCLVAITCQLYSISLNTMIRKSLDNSRSGEDSDNS